MLYNFNHNKYNDFCCFEDNKLSPRAYFIPFKDRQECDACDYWNERYSSSIVRCLNGKWDFLYYPRISDMPAAMDTYFTSFGKIDVPGCWQYQGYEKPYYVNVRYQFDAHPPYVPSDKGIIGKNTPLGSPLSPDNQVKKPVTVYNSVGLYRKQFTVKHAARHVLTFLGVASCMQLYVNGRYVGYSEGSHNTAEFDITGFVFDGTNEMVVLVYKWCNGTYLEAQDMFRNNGIFRDVYITDYSDNYVWDYNVHTHAHDKDYTIDVDVTAVLSSDSTLTATLYYGAEVVGETQVTDSRISFNVPAAMQWSAEDPQLYHLYFTIRKKNKEVFCVRQEVGLRDIVIKGNVLYFNNMPIKLKGVNHHDTTPDKGYYMTPEEILRDVKLMKDYNVNCMRTSHYPPDPVAIKAANYMGLYVVDEADIETHGVGATLPIPNINRISANSKWKDRYWDRVYRMYMRDRNSACVLMWSLGNESGGYKCQDYCYSRLKALDPSAVIHYEGVIRTPRWCYDVVSQMYTSTQICEKYVAGKLPAKYYRAPFFLCEYAHAMGVGAGSLDKYTELFESADSFLGGCIWEWADHAAKDSFGNYMYGGDNGEPVHDYNFCVDGLFFPDRRPHTGALSMKVAYRPVRAAYVSSNKYRFTNTNYFASTTDMAVRWSCRADGETVAGGDFDLLVPPRDYTDVTLRHPMLDITYDCYMVFTYYRKSDGEEIATEQIELSKFIPSLLEVGKGDLALVEEHERTIVSARGDDGNEVRVEFDNAGGNIVSYSVGGVELVAQEAENKGFNICLYAAPIDNYMNIDRYWRKKGMRDISVTCDAFVADRVLDGKVGRAVIKTRQSVFLAGKKRMTLDTSYTVQPNGYIDVTSTVYSNKVLELPRFGLMLDMPQDFTQVCYYGRGPVENYPDFKLQSVMGVYEDTADNMYVPYIKPQDSGNRCDCRWAFAGDKKGNGIKFIAKDYAFSFCAQNVSQDSLLSARHDFEVEKDNLVHVSLLRFVRGVGSNSCGPDARDEYRYFTGRGKEMSLSFRMIPVCGKGGEKDS